MTFDFAAAARGLGNDPRRLADLARLARVARDPIAPTLARQARALAPDDRAVRALTEAAMIVGVPAWHPRIVRDTHRLDAYRAAIEREVRPGDRVLDIGAGTGILAMMAARAGAGHVYACESNATVADIARRIIAANGYADRITLIPEWSTRIDAERDLGGRVDVIVSELLADDLLGEGVLRYLHDASQRLLKPGGRMTPTGGEVRIAAAEWPRYDARPSRHVDGFDLSPVDELATRREKVPQRRAGEIVVRGPSVALFDADFTLGDAQMPTATTATLDLAGGRINGIVMWMRLRFDDAHAIETFPLPEGIWSSWSPIFYPLDADIDSPAGRTLTVHAVREPDAICLWTDPVA